MSEQEKGAGQIIQATESMRKGAATTVRALAEQSTAIEQVAKETDRLISQFASLTKAMGEQANSSREVTAATADLDLQARQVTQGMKEQALGFKQITTNSANIAKQIKSIAASNLENSQSTTVILKRIQEVRDVSRENGQFAKSIERIVGERRVAAPALPRRNGRRERPSSSDQTVERA